MKIIKTVSCCRLCDSSNIRGILNFGEIALANSYRKSICQANETLIPLRVFQCCDCGSNQLFDEINSEVLFQNYYYVTPTVLQKHFNEYAATTLSKLNHANCNSLILGIGGNNGLLESEYQKLGYSKVYNIEPAKNIAEMSINNKVPTINKFFNTETALQILNEYGLAELITCNNCFAHISNLNEIVNGIKLLLAPDGMFVFENAYGLDTFCSNSDPGQIYHEHIYYHSVKPLKQFLEKHGLELVDVTLNDNQLGSLRCYVSWPGAYNISSSVHNLIKIEKDFGLYNTDTYEKFTQDVGHIGDELKSQIESCGGKVALYGVPAKITLLIKLWDLEKYIDYAVDSTETKIDHFIPGTNIPIKPIEFWIADNPAATLIGAYNYENHIRNKHAQYRNWIMPFQ